MDKLNCDLNHPIGEDQKRKVPDEQEHLGVKRTLQTCCFVLR